MAVSYELDFPGTERFEVRARLGSGGMGVVYRAYDREKDTELALKTFLRPDAEGVYRLKKEFRGLADLRHRNVIALDELVCEGTRWFFTMELIEGCDLLEWVRGDIPRLRDSMRQLARGLVAIHDAGKVHRDIKPSNVLVERATGRVVILDFGLVTRDADSGAPASTLDDRLVGTVNYMAPEQAASRPVGAPADWYAFGVILYEALTGRTPVTGDPLQVLMEKQRPVTRRPWDLSPDVPEDLDQLCMALLDLDPDRRPLGRAVLESLGEARRPSRSIAVPPQSSSSEPTFVGRAAEVDVLWKAYQDVRRGAAVTVRVTGESGVGKSALVRQLVKRVRADHEEAVLLAGRCHEREIVPYKAFDDVIDTLSQGLIRMGAAEAAAVLPLRAALLARVFPVLGRVEAVARSPRPSAEILDPQELRARAFASLRELFARLVERRPVVVTLDDLQWADADSLALLGELLHPPNAPAMLVVATIRSGAPGDIPLALPGDVRDVAVEPLPLGEATTLATLIAASLGGAVHAAPEVIAAEARGNPLYIDELVRHARGHGSAAGTLPSLDETLGVRLAVLDPAARRVVEVVALASAPLAAEVVARAAEVGISELHALVPALRDANLVRATAGRGGTRMEPFHDRVRQALLARLSEEARRGVHERLAVALETQGGASLEALTVHWSGAGEVARAAGYAVSAAANAAGALAFDRAADLYRTALELRAGDVDARRDLAEKLGRALENAGRGAEAAHAYLEAASGAAPADELALLRRAAEQLLRSGHIDEGLVVLARVLERVGLGLPRTPRRALLSLVMRRTWLRLRGLGHRRRDRSEVTARDLARIDACWSAASGLSVVDTIRGADFQARHLLLALSAGEPLRLARALATEAGYQAATGTNRRRAAQCLDASWRLARRVDDAEARGRATMVEGFTRFLRGEWQRTVELMDQATSIFQEECVGVAWELASTRVFALYALVYRGHLAELARRMPHYLREAEERGDRYFGANLRTGVTGCFWLAADQPQRGRQAAHDAMHRWAQTGFHMQHWFELFAQTQIDLYAGEGQRAYDRIRGGWTALGRSQLRRVQHTRIESSCLLGRAALAAASAGGGSQLLRIAATCARRLGAERVPWALGVSDLLAAGVAAHRGKLDVAAQRLEVAIGRLLEADLGLHAAAAMRRLAELDGETSGGRMAEADAAFAAQGVVAPERLTLMLAPGFRDQRSPLQLAQPPRGSGG